MEPITAQSIQHILCNLRTFFLQQILPNKKSAQFSMCLRERASYQPTYLHIPGSPAKSLSQQRQGIY